MHALAFDSGGSHLSQLEVVTATTLQVGVDLLGTLCCFDVKQKLRRVKRDFKFGRDIARGDHHEL